jgi:LmbE family N-acetylglucosaminyl deacetylase
MMRFFSCGGRISQLATVGNVLVLNVFSDYGSKTSRRTAEEKAAASLLGYEPHFLGFPDFRKRDRFHFFPPAKHRLLSFDYRDWIKRLQAIFHTILEEVDFEEL